MNRLIKADGTETELIPTGENGEFTLEEIQAVVGGYIDQINIPNDRKMIMLVDEEGLPKKLPYNTKASLMLGEVTVGPVAVIERRLFK